MKISLIFIFIFIITFIDFSSGLISFEVGEQYEYKYSGKVLTGLPDIDAHFAGFVMACDVYIQHHHPNNYKLALKNVAFAKFHEKLDGPEPKNWRTLSTPTPSPIDPALVQFLEAPVEFTMMNGRINNIRLSSHEPQWTGNIKRAVLDLFKIQTPLVDNGIQQNIINKSGQNIPDYFETMEEGINGICESIYTITELPAYLTKDLTTRAAELLHLKVCTGQKIFQITKVRDVTKCKKINHYVSRTRMEKQIPAKTSITNIVGCGLTKESIMLHGVIQEGESLHNMDGLNTEPMVTGFQRVLHLQEVRSVMTKLPDIDQPRSMDTVVYEFALKSDSVPQQTIAASLAKGDSPPLASWQSFKTPEIQNAISQLHTEAIKADVINKLTGIAADLSNDEHVADKQVTSQLMSVIHVFTTLTNGDIHDLHREIKALAGIEQDMRDTIMDLWLDIATMAGTTDSVLFLKHIIETEDVTSFRSVSTIMTLGHYIRTPTVDHLNYFFTIVKSPVVMKNKMIKHNAIHNFANMINKACIAYEEPKHFPTHTFGEFCSSATSQIVTTYIPYLIKQLRNVNDADDKEAYIIALSTIGHEAVLPILLPIIEGKVSSHTASNRIMSILTLNTVVKKHRDVLLPVYSIILFNHLEERNIRIAALSMILKAEPNFTFMQRLAVSTWHENDPEMAMFIFSTLKFLGEKEFETMTGIGSMEKMVEMAKAVLPLAKRVPGILFYSSNLFISEYLNDLYVGYEHHSTFTFAPQGNTMFSKIIYFLDKIQLPVVELAFNLKGEKTLFEQLRHEFSTLIYGVKKNNNDIVNKIHAEWKKIVQDMGIKAREDIPFHAALCLNLFDDAMAHVGADQTSLDHLKSSIQSILGTIMKDPKAKMRPMCNKELKFNFNKVFNLLPTEVITSSDLGVPIFSETHAPHLLALKGFIQLSNCNATIPTVEIALNTKLIGDWYTYTGILVPTTKEIVLSAVAEHRSFNIPMKISLTAHPFSGRLVVDLVPTVDINATSVDIFHYHVKPFTCIRKITDFTPLTLHPDNKPIQSKPMANKFVKNMGNTTGIALDATLEVDNDSFDMTTVIDRFGLYKHNPANILKFFFTDRGVKLNGMPSNRLTKLTLLYNPTTSSTKHMTLDIEIAIASMHGPHHNPFQYKFQHTPIFKLIEAPLTQETPMKKNLVKALTNLKSQSKNIVFSTLTNIHLKGNVSKTYKLGFTAGLDLGKSSKKWMIHTELVTNGLQEIHACLDGELQQPIIPLWDIEHLLTSNITFTFKNDIRFGQDCGEYKISLNGVASVTDIQKSLSRNSRAAQLCKQAGSLSQRQGGQHGILPQHAACQMQRDQAATLDHLKLYVNLTQLPPTATFYQEVLESYIKLLLLPHIEPSSWFDKSVSNMSKSNAQCEFNAEQNVVTIKLISTANQVVIKDIRLPSAVHGIIPMIATKTSVGQLNEALTGLPLNPTCHVSETGQIQTFDRHLYTYKMDGCYHVLCADCTAKFSFSVLVRETAGMKHAKIFHINNQFSLKFPLVYLNGLQLEIPRNNTRTLHTMNNHFIYTISRTVDDVFIVDTPIFVVEYNGHSIQVKSKQLKITGQLCGLCGDNNKDSRFDLKSPTDCLYKSDLLSALSYRHQTPKCPALPKDKMDMMAAEEAYCASAMKYMNHHSQFQPVIGSHAKHFIIKNLKSQICISKLPLSFCLPSFIPKSNIHPMIPYTCITHPSNKVVKHYKQKVNSGAILPELNMLKTHLTIPTKIPQYCSEF